MQREKSKGHWIREYLQENGPAYVRELHSAFEEWCIENEYENPPDYEGMRRTVWLLKDAGLLVEAGTEPSERGGFHRQYYRVAPDAPDDAPEWSDPLTERYG